MNFFRCISRQLNKHQVEAEQNNSILYFLNTLHLFTKSDTNYTVAHIIFSILSTLAGPVLTTNQHPQFTRVLLRLPILVLWSWLHTLAFCCANQRHPSSVMEDKINKPYRPIPAGRITSQQTQQLLIATMPILYMLSYFFGGLEQTMLVYMLSWVYNDMGGGNSNGIIRNILVALGWSNTSLGAFRVGCGFPKYDVNQTMYPWIIMIILVMVTTSHVQDLRDMTGDRSKDRKTLPLFMGEDLCRSLLVAGIMFWSIMVPMFWFGMHKGMLGYILPLAGGVYVSWRIMTKKTSKQDCATYKFWSLWLMSFYVLPIFARFL